MSLGHVQKRYANDKSSVQHKTSTKVVNVVNDCQTDAEESRSRFFCDLSSMTLPLHCPTLSVPNTIRLPSIYGNFNKFEGCTRVLESMFYPSLFTFLTCGLLASFVLPGAWAPDAKFAPLVALGTSNILPAVAAFGVGYTINGLKTGLVSAVVSIGSIGSAQIPMFFASVIMSLLVSYVVKMLEYCVNTFVKDRFVFLTSIINTTLLTFTGLAGIYLSYTMFKPLVEELLPVLADGVESLLNAWKPLSHILIEPMKVLFISSSSVLSQMGSGATTTSIYYTFESNPGPGIGLLTGLLFVSPTVVSSTIPLALLILAIGGAHFVYFPFVFMYPQTLVPLILGGVTATGIFEIADFGLTGVPSPASLMKLVDMTESGSVGTLWLGIILSAVVSFIVTLLVTEPRTVLRRLTCNRLFRAKVSI